MRSNHREVRRHLETAGIVIFAIIGWYALQRFIFPRFGVAT